MPAKVKRSSAPKHKTTLDRERTKQEVARWQAFGYSSRQIEAKLGGRVSHVTVCQYLKEVAEGYRTSQLSSREQYVNEKLEQIRLLRMEAFAAWEKSKLEVRSVKDEDGERSLEEVEGAGDATFLRVMAELYRDERELLGLDAPKRSQTASVSVTVDGAEALKVVGFDALAEPEPVEAEIERVKALPAPAPKQE